MIVEAGYPWTASWNDNANNILYQTNPNYFPLSPTIQKKWLVDLTEQVIDNGGKGVIYWEPAWVSSTCSTRWAQGSHYENATFFDFNNNLQNDGGIGFMTHDYGIISSVKNVERLAFNTFKSDNQLIIEVDSLYWKSTQFVQLTDIQGRILEKKKLLSHKSKMSTEHLETGIYIISIIDNGGVIGTKKILID